MESCASSSGSSSSPERLPLAETSPGCAPPCVRAVSLPFVWRVPSSVGTLSFAVCTAQCAPARGERGPGLHGRSRGGSCARGPAGQCGQQQGSHPGSTCVSGALLAQPLQKPLRGTAPCSATALAPLMTPLPRVKSPPAAVSFLCPWGQRSLLQSGAWQGQSTAAMAASGMLCGGAHRAAAGIRVPAGSTGRQRLPGWQEGSGLRWAALSAHPCASHGLRLSMSAVTQAVLP